MPDAYHALHIGLNQPLFCDLNTLETSSIPNPPARIYINGFMGSGKSTVGPLLARALGWDFYDLDDRIEEIIGMPIAAYFKQEGEPAFRAVEREALHESESVSQTVIAQIH